MTKVSMTVNGKAVSAEAEGRTLLSAYLREGLGLTSEQARVLELYRQMFIRSGAALDGAAAERLTAVKARLAVLGTAFGQNLLADERSWFMEIGGEDLAALPEFVQAAAKAAGEERGSGPVITLNRAVAVSKVKGPEMALAMAAVSLGSVKRTTFPRRKRSAFIRTQCNRNCISKRITGLLSRVK